MTIDLNADLGEGDPFDLELLAVVSSCNIACGGHVGDMSSMTATVRAAMANDVTIGAHPSYPDPEGFGRRRDFLVGEKLRKIITKQIDMLQEVIEAEGVTLSHVKPHGALYSDAASNDSIARLLVEVVAQVGRNVAVVGAPNSALQRAANDAGLNFVGEAFVDRAYLPDGTLVPRTEIGAVHTELNTITTQAVSLATAGSVCAQNGAVIQVAARTLCIHGDTPNAGEAARAVRDVLQANEVEIRAPH